MAAWSLSSLEPSMRGVGSFESGCGSRPRSASCLARNMFRERRTNRLRHTGRAKRALLGALSIFAHNSF